MLSLLSWLLIAFVIALIFGVIKIKDIETLLPKAKELFSTTKIWSEKKIAQLKEKIENKDSDNNSSQS